MIISIVSEKGIWKVFTYIRRKTHSKLEVVKNFLLFKYFDNMNTYW